MSKNSFVAITVSAFLFLLFFRHVPPKMLVVMTLLRYDEAGFQVEAGRNIRGKSRATFTEWEFRRVDDGKAETLKMSRMWNKYLDREIEVGDEIILLHTGSAPKFARLVPHSFKQVKTILWIAVESVLLIVWIAILFFTWRKDAEGQ